MTFNELLYNEDTHRSTPFNSEGCSHRSPVKEMKEMLNVTRIWLIHAPCFLAVLF
jgi:hypothetical protein